MQKWVEGTVVNQKRWTQTLFTLQVEADIARFEAGQFAKLALSEIPEGENLWLISTGTGVGPFLSILKTEGPWQRFKQVVLVHAVRYAEELTYRDSVSRLLGEHGEQMRMVSFVSRESIPGALHGRIPLAIEEGRLEAAAEVVLSAKTSQVMICGNPEMVTDTSAALVRRGMKKHRRREPGQITVENYW